MEARELRIGNLINIEGKAIKIGIIKEKFISWNIAKYSENRIWNPFIPVNDERLKPIKLTEEWVIKLNCPETFLSKDINGHFVWFNGEKIYLRYVHELQNLYYALTREELTLK